MLAAPRLRCGRPRRSVRLPVRPLRAASRSRWRPPPGRRAPACPRWAGAGPAPFDSGAESSAGWGRRVAGWSRWAPPPPPPPPEDPPEPEDPPPRRPLAAPRIAPPAAPSAPPARAAPPRTLPPTRPSVAAPSLRAWPAAARTPAPIAADSESAATISISAHGAIAASAKIVIAAMIVPADDAKLPLSDRPASAAFPANASTISVTGLRITNRNSSRAEPARPPREARPDRRRQRHREGTGRRGRSPRCGPRARATRSPRRSPG